MACSIENGEELNWNVDWERDFGKLLPGVYRINRTIESSSSFVVNEYNKKLYATFIVIF